MTEWGGANVGGLLLDSYPFFARDLQLDLLLPQLLPLAVVPAKRSSLLLDLLLPSHLIEDTVIKYRYIPVQAYCRSVQPLDKYEYSW